MSKENAKKFFETLKADKALAEEMQNALKAQKFETQEQAQKVVIDFAASKGFAFTAADFDELKKEAAELSDSDLDQVNAAGWEDILKTVITIVPTMTQTITSIVGAFKK